MIYYNNNLEIINCPYAFLSLDKEINLLDKKVAIMPLVDYQHFSKLTDAVDLLFLHEWSGWAKIPSNLPANVFVFYYDYNYLNVIDTNIFYFPQWLFYVANTKNTGNITTDYLFSCACRNFNNGRPNKIYNYQMLKNKLYFDKILFTKFKSIEPFELYALPEIQDVEFNLIVDKFLIDYNGWQKMDGAGLDLVTSMSAMDLNVYKKSLFHIIAESATHQPALSEKTFKVFAVGQIPIMCGPRYAIQHLRELGFDVFDDIVDHSYDGILDWKTRINAMHTSLDKLAELDINIILDQTHIRRTKNKQHLKSKKLHKILLDPIINQLTR
jgi:hypothetical protein